MPEFAFYFLYLVSGAKNGAANPLFNKYKPKTFIK
jgi:hypothetical protein